MISHWMEWGAKCCKHTSKIFQVIPSQAKTAWGLWAKTVSRKPNAFFTTAAAGCLMPTSQFPAEGIFLGSSPSPICCASIIHSVTPCWSAIAFNADTNHQSPVTHYSPIEPAALRTLQDICKLDFKIFQDISSAFPCFPSCSTGEFFSRPDRQNRSFPQNRALVWPWRRRSVPWSTLWICSSSPLFCWTIEVSQKLWETHHQWSNKRGVMPSNSINCWTNTINSHHIPHYGKKRNVHAPLKRLFWAFLAHLFSCSNSKHQSTTQLKPLG